MKVLVRFMSITIIGIIVCFCLIYLINVNIVINEMNNASKVAIEACQRIVKSKTIDELLLLDSSENEIYDDDSYKNYFINTFHGLVHNKDIYDLDVMCDYEKGLIAVYIHNKYSSFINDKKLINIIEVCE